MICLFKLIQRKIQKSLDHLHNTQTTRRYITIQKMLLAKLPSLEFSMIFFIHGGIFN